MIVLVVGVVVGAVREPPLRAPFVLQTFPPRAGETLPLFPEHTSLLLSIFWARAPLRFAKGQGDH